MVKKRVNFPIEESIYKRLKMLSAEEGLTIGETIGEILKTINKIVEERKKELRGIDSKRLDETMKEVELTTLEIAEFDNEAYENFKKYIKGENVFKNIHDLKQNE